MANSFTGPITVSGGTLNLQVAGALGSASSITVASGAAITLQNSQTYGASAGTLTLNGTGAGTAGQTGALDNLSGANTYAGLIALGSNATISSDAGALNISNAGTITGGGLHADFGRRQRRKQHARQHHRHGTPRAVTVVKNGTGSWTLSGNSTYGGATTVNAGTLTLAGTNETSALGPQWRLIGYRTPACFWPLPVSRSAWLGHPTIR